MPITAIILAAGSSTRFGAENKLLIAWDGKPLVRHVVQIVKSEIDDVTVVLGYEPDEIRGALSGIPVSFVLNEGHEAGMASSIRSGVAACKAGFSPLIVLGDMPWHTPALISRIKSAFDRADPPAIIVPRHHERWGNPVLFDSVFRKDLLALSGDTGARPVVEANMARVVFVDAALRELEDVDFRDSR